MFGGSSSNIVLHRIAGRGSIPCLFKRGYEIFGGDDNEEAKVPCHGEFEKTS